MSHSHRSKPRQFLPPLNPCSVWLLTGQWTQWALVMSTPHCSLCATRICRRYFFCVLACLHRKVKALSATQQQSQTRVLLREGFTRPNHRATRMHQDLTTALEAGRTPLTFWKRQHKRNQIAAVHRNVLSQTHNVLVHVIVNPLKDAYSTSSPPRGYCSRSSEWNQEVKPQTSAGISFEWFELSMWFFFFGCFYSMQLKVSKLWAILSFFNFKWRLMTGGSGLHSLVCVWGYIRHRGESISRQFCFHTLCRSSARLYVSCRLV